MFKVSVHMALVDGDKCIHVDKDIQLPFVPVQGMGLDFGEAPTFVTDVGYFVGQDDFFVEVELPEEMWIHEGATTKGRKVTVEDFVEMMKAEGFAVAVWTGGPKGQKSRGPTREADHRYNRAQATGRLLSYMEGHRISQKRVAEAMGITESEFSQKKRGNQNSFSLEEYGAAANYLSAQTRKPLIGFPFLESGTQDEVDRKVGGWKGSQRS